MSLDEQAMAIATTFDRLADRMMLADDEQAIAAVLAASGEAHRTREWVTMSTGAHWTCACGSKGTRRNGAKRHQAQAILLALIELGWRPAQVIEGEVTGDGEDGKAAGQVSDQ